MASEIKDHVYDRYTREQLVGASISVNRGSIKAVLSLEGKYYLKNIAAGK